MATSKIFRTTGRGRGDAASGPARAYLVLAPRAERIPVARAFVREALGRWHPCAETAVLLTSELVTNSVRHSGSRHLGQTITIAAIVHGSGVRIEVTDCNGPTVPALRTGGEMAEGGRGLQLVQALSAHWGYRRDDSRTTTWFVCSPLIHEPSDPRVRPGGGERRGIDSR